MKIIFSRVVLHMKHITDQFFSLLSLYLLISWSEIDSQY